MAYSIETYMQIKSISELDRRIKLIEPLIRVTLRQEEMVRRSIEDQEWGRNKLAEVVAELEDLKLEVLNIMTAQELLRGSK